LREVVTEKWDNFKSESHFARPSFVALAPPPSFLPAPAVIPRCQISGAVRTGRIKRPISFVVAFCCLPRGRKRECGDLSCSSGERRCQQSMGSTRNSNRLLSFISAVSATVLIGKSCGFFSVKTELFVLGSGLAAKPGPHFIGVKPPRIFPLSRTSATVDACPSSPS
jgi:hypothetical protein